MFHELSRAEVIQMVDLMTKRLVGQLEGQGLGIELTQSAKELLAVDGLRPAARCPSDAPGDPAHIEDSLSEKLLYKEFSRRRDHRRRHRGRPDKPGQAALHVHGGRGLRAAVVGRARHHGHREPDAAGERGRTRRPPN